MGVRRLGAPEGGVVGRVTDQVWGGGQVTVPLRVG